MILSVKFTPTCGSTRKLRGMAETETIRRPSPDALLVEAQREDKSRGRLKVFLGAAPGVGKTYEMLLSAKAKLAEGADVVVGVVETHGRAETEVAAERFRGSSAREDQLSRPYRSTRWTWMPSSSAARRSRLSTNSPTPTRPGSRHPKRYLDVEDLLAAGIDVYTTLNIQHVESLNDVVAQITRIRVRETVPDLVLNKADDIEVIDLSPDELIQRLQGRQGLRPEAGRARAQPLFLARQPHRAEGTRAPADRPARRRAASDPYARARHRRALARGRTSPRLRQRGPALRGAGALHEAAFRQAARALDRDLYRNPAAASISPRSSAIALPTRCVSRKSFRAKRSQFQAAATLPRTSSPFRAPIT